MTGRWRFGSGCQDADLDDRQRCRSFDGGRRGRRRAALQENRYVIFPRHDVKIHRHLERDRHARHRQPRLGRDRLLRAGRLTEPSRLVQGPNSSPRPWRGALYRFPLASVAALHFSAVATGLARRAIDTLVELAQVKTPHRSPGLLRERVQVQEAVARAEVALESARAYRDQVIDDAWRTVEAGERADDGAAGAHPTRRHQRRRERRARGRPDVRRRRHDVDRGRASRSRVASATCTSSRSTSR